MPSFDPRALEPLAERLPHSALPRFVRQVEALTRTSSLKLKRRSWADEGVDPEKVAGPLWVLDNGHYVRLDAAAHRDIVTGKLRL